MQYKNFIYFNLYLLLMLIINDDKLQNDKTIWINVIFFLHRLDNFKIQYINICLNIKNILSDVYILYFACQIFYILKEISI